jgi:hypothetical protein
MDVSDGGGVPQGVKPRPFGQACLQSERLEVASKEIVAVHGAACLGREDEVSSFRHIRCGSMQDVAFGLRRTPLPRTWANKG